VPERSSRAHGPSANFTLGDWLVQPSLNRISQGETEVRLRPQLMDVLVCLAERAGRTVTKNELLDLVWPGQYIVESGLARCVAEIRQILGDTARQEPRYIETISKRGYRLVAPVAFLAAEPAQAAAPGIDPVPGPVAAAGEAMVVPDIGPGDAPAEATAQADPVPGTCGAGVSRVSVLRRRWIVLVAAGTVLVAVAAALSWRFFQPPPIAERDQVVLAFDNATGDAVFDAPLRLALLVQLEQSPYLRVVGEQRVRDELGFMHLPADTPISRDVARQICRRLGAKAVLSGSLVALGRHYVIGIEAIGCRSGDVLVRDQLEVESKEAVLTGLGQAVSAIRRKLR
jgi:DNA-binding winged helix-turn-helix (wHTH) protein